MPIRVNLSEWKMRHHLEWSKAGNELNKDATTATEKLNSMMATIIREWPYEGQPNDPTAYMDLRPQEWRACLKAVEQAVADSFRDVEAAPVSGDHV